MRLYDRQALLQKQDFIHRLLLLNTIKAFKNVIKEVPEAKLEIWGKGNKEQDYVSLIKEPGLKKNVELKDTLKHRIKYIVQAPLL